MDGTLTLFKITNSSKLQQYSFLIIILFIYKAKI